MAIIITGDWAYAETEAEISGGSFPDYCTIFAKDTQNTWKHDIEHDPILFLVSKANNIPDTTGNEGKILKIVSGELSWESAGSGGYDGDPTVIIQDSTHRFVSDVQLTAINNTSGTNTGDQDLSNYFKKDTDDSDDVNEGVTNLFLTSAERTKLTNTSGTNTGDQDLSGYVIENDVKGGADTLNDRLNTISNFASPNAGGVVTGQYYDNSFQGTASSTLAGAANRIDLAPYYTSVTLNIDRIGVAVSTAVASAQAKVVIYSSDSNGWPDTLLHETAALDCGSTGMKEETLTFTFNSGVQYWVGVRHSSTATLRTINVSSAVNLGLTSSTAANYATILRRTLTFATAATSPWNFTNTDRVANVTPPSIRFRAA